MCKGKRATFFLCVATLLCSGHGSAAEPTAFGDAVAGHWIGTLEYRDYSNGRRVTLPTVLDIDKVVEGVIDFHYVYDDGPGKTVRETSHVTDDPVQHRYVVASDDERDVYRIVEQSGFSGGDSGRMLLSGAGKENNRTVNIRTSIVRNDNELTILRESQLPGEPFKFRHQYRFTRHSASPQ